MLFNINKKQSVSSGPNLQQYYLELKTSYAELLSNNINLKSLHDNLTHSYDELKLSHDALISNNAVLKSSNEMLTVSNEEIKNSYNVLKRSHDELILNNSVLNLDTLTSGVKTQNDELINEELERTLTPDNF